MTEIAIYITALLIVGMIAGLIVVTLREVFTDGSAHPRAPRSHVPDLFDPRNRKLA